MKLMSWNVNGLRAVVKKGFTDQIEALAPDILGLQETKAQDDQVREALFGWDMYDVHSSSASEKKGYSGTAILTTSTTSIQAGIGVNALTKKVVLRRISGFSFRHGARPTQAVASNVFPFENNGTKRFARISQNSTQTNL